MTIHKRKKRGGQKVRERNIEKSSFSTDQIFSAKPKLTTLLMFASRVRFILISAALKLKQLAGRVCVFNFVRLARMRMWHQS